MSISSRKTLPVSKRDAAQRSVADGAGLLVNFLEHEVLEAGLFRHDRVPGDVLHLAGDGMAVEVGELTPCGVMMARSPSARKKRSRVWWRMPGTSEATKYSSFAEADDGGRPIARGDNLVGLVGRR